MREDNVLLLDFCKQQYREFKVDDWLTLSRVSKRLKIAALFLKGMAWYKREQDWPCYASNGNWN